MTSKPTIRRKMRAVRDAVSAEELAAASEKIVSQLLNAQFLANCRSWFVYVSTGSEVQTHALIRALLGRTRIISVPLIVGQGEVIARQLHTLEELRQGEFGILAPLPGQPYSDLIDAAICPGVAFSERGERLGLGRGFYDRFLATHAPRHKVGLALECQIVPELPCEAHDRPMDMVVTENRVLRCRNMRTE